MYYCPQDLAYQFRCVGIDPSSLGGSSSLSWGSLLWGSFSMIVRLTTCWHGPRRSDDMMTGLAWVNTPGFYPFRFIWTYPPNFIWRKLKKGLHACSCSHAHVILVSAPVPIGPLQLYIWDCSGFGIESRGNRIGTRAWQLIFSFFSPKLSFFSNLSHFLSSGKDFLNIIRRICQPCTMTVSISTSQ